MILYSGQEWREAVRNDVASLIHFGTWRLCPRNTVTGSVATTRGEVKIIYKPPGEMVADGLTKAQSGRSVMKLATNLHMDE